MHPAISTHSLCLSSTLGPPPFRTRLQHHLLRTKGPGTGRHHGRATKQASRRHAGESVQAPVRLSDAVGVLALKLACTGDVLQEVAGVLRVDGAASAGEWGLVMIRRLPSVSQPMLLVPRFPVSRVSRFLAFGFTSARPPGNLRALVPDPASFRVIHSPATSPTARGWLPSPP